MTSSEEARASTTDISRTICSRRWLDVTPFRAGRSNCRFGLHSGGQCRRSLEGPQGYLVGMHRSPTPLQRAHIRRCIPR